MKFFSSKKTIVGLAIGFTVAATTGTALAAYVITGGNKNGSVSTLKPTEVEIKNEVVDLSATVENSNLLFQPEKQVTKGRVTTDVPGKMTLGLDIAIASASVDLIKDVTITASPVYVNPEKNTGIESYIKFDPITIDHSTFTTLQSEEVNIYTCPRISLVWSWTGIYNIKDGIAGYYNNKTVEEISDDKLLKEMTTFKDITNNIKNYTVTIKMAE